MDTAGCALCVLLLSLCVGLSATLTDLAESPKFGGPIANVTVPVGREAVLVCVVECLGSYKVAWLRGDTQTILTIHTHVVTKHHRIAVTHSDHRIWQLHIRDVRQVDGGWYMCQINTDPMKSQTGFLEVVVPPDILDYPTSTDMVVREGSNVTLKCAASGSPAPNITWRREAGEKMFSTNGQEVTSAEGPVFNLVRVNRLHMGAYLCIASNGVPPTVSKRIMLIVHFPPMIWIQNQLVGAQLGQQITLECYSEAYPKSINYWTKNGGEIIAYGAKYDPVLLDNAYRVHMKLTIRSVGATDFGDYKCVSKNSLGETDGTVKLYQIPDPTTTSTTESTSLSVTSHDNEINVSSRQEAQLPPLKKDLENDIILMAEEISHSLDGDGSKTAERSGNTYTWPRISASAVRSDQYTNSCDTVSILFVTLFTISVLSVPDYWL